MAGEEGKLVASEYDGCIEGKTDAEGIGTIAKELMEYGPTEAEAGEIRKIGGDASMSVNEGDTGSWRLS